MNKFNAEFKIGLTALIAISLLVWGINFLRGNNIFSNADQYISVYQNIDGMEVSSPVRVNGLTWTPSISRYPFLFVHALAFKFAIGIT